MSSHYLTPLPTCQTERCNRSATVELRNHRNERITVHCAAHGKRALIKIEANHHHDLH